MKYIQLVLLITFAAIEVLAITESNDACTYCCTACIFTGNKEKCRAACTLTVCGGELCPKNATPSTPSGSFSDTQSGGHYGNPYSMRPSKVKKITIEFNYQDDRQKD